MTTPAEPESRLEPTASYPYAPLDCPNPDHESGMVYDLALDDALCPLCGTHASVEMGSL